MKKGLITCWHFIPGNKIHFLNNVSEYLKYSTFKVILDLEDAVTNLQNKRNATELKESARRSILEFFGKNRKGNYYIRINSPNSEFWEKDKEFLKKLSKKIKIKGIVIPKANGYKDLKLVSYFVSKYWKKKLDLVPLIETKEGVENLDHLLKNFKINALIFGHHDYFYDCNIFPIPDSIITSENYRDIFFKIMNKIKDKGIEYVDGIHPLLDDEFGLNKICEYLYRHRNGNKIGKLSVHIKQIKPLMQFKPENIKIDGSNFSDNLTNKEKDVLAKKIIAFYEKKPLDRGITKMNNQYISPQMYMSAKNYLKKHKRR
jgi:citrate lyase beta subunit